MSETVQIKTPWLASKDPEVPSTLNYSTLSMCGRVEEMVRQYPNYIAYEFMGKTTTYAEMWQKINACAKSLKAIGIREGDKVTICMPIAPQTLCMFYAVNMVGAIANMVHPLSAESEISFYLRDSNSVAAITLDQFYPKFESVRKTVDLPCLIVTSVADELKPLLRVGYQLTEGRKNPKVPRGPGVVLWKDFLTRMWRSTASSARTPIPPPSSTPAAPPASPRASCSPTATLTLWPPRSWPPTPSSIRVTRCWPSCPCSTASDWVCPSIPCWSTAAAASLCPGSRRTATQSCC